MTARTDYPGLKQDGGDTPQQKANVVNGLLLGRTNNTFDLTLTINSATTVVTDVRIGALSTFNFDPRTAHAATELYGATMWVSAVSNGSMTVTNANNAQADRTFVVTIFAAA